MVCKLGRLLGNTHSLSQPDRALLRQWLQDGRDGKGRRVSAQDMAAALTAEGHDVGSTTLKDHRGGRCACYRKADA